MKYLDFEKHIKKELGNAKEPVQMDALLASLSLGDEKPSRKGFALWMLLPFLLVIGSFLTWNLLGDETKMDMETMSNVNSQGKEKIMSTKHESSTNTGIIDRSTIISSENQTENQTENQAESQTENSTAKITNDYKANSGDNQLRKLTNSSKENTLIKANQPSNLVENEKDQSFRSHEGKRLNFNAVPDLNNQSDILNNSYIKKEASQNSEIQDENRMSTALAIPESATTVSRSISSVADLDNSFTLLEDESDDGNMFSRMKINCPSFDNSGWHMALIPEIGIFKPFKTLENLSNGESGVFIEREESEKTLEGLEVALYGMLVRDKIPMYLKAGVSYSRISERMDLEYEYTELDTTIGIISTTISGNGDTITHIYGDIVTETTYKGSNRQHHYIHIFDLPVSVGYTTYLAGLDIGIEAGVRINFMTRATGNLLISQGEYTNLSLNRLFKNRVGLSYFGGLMIGRNFGKFGDIYIAPRFTYYPDDFSNQNNAIGQKYFNIGLNAGVVYKIN